MESNANTHIHYMHTMIPQAKAVSYMYYCILHSHLNLSVIYNILYTTAKFFNIAIHIPRKELKSNVSGFDPSKL